MADSYAIFVAKAHYFARQGFYNSVTIAATEGLRRHANDPYLRWLSAYGVLMQDRVQDAIRDLEAIRDKPDINIAACMALLVAHKKCRTVDQTAVKELESRIRDDRKQAGDTGLLYAGTFLFLNGRYDKAREYFDRAAKMANGQNRAVTTMKGWNDLLLASEASDDAEMKKAVRLFDEAGANERPPNLEAALGKCVFFELRRNYAGALELSSSLASQYGNSFPQIYVEKARLNFLQFEYDTAFESAQRALAIDSDCVDAHRFSALLRLARDADHSAACDEIRTLVDVLKRVEPRNVALFNQVAQLFIRYSSRRADVLSRVSDLLEFAGEVSAQIASGAESLRAEALGHLGVACLMCMRVGEARRCFSDALKVDEGCVAALSGLIRTNLLEENVDEAAQQLEFINEARQPSGQQAAAKSAEFLLLEAIVTRKRKLDTARARELLFAAIDAHGESVRATPMSPGLFDFLVVFNPDLHLEMVAELLEAQEASADSTSQVDTASLKKAQALLESVARYAPGATHVTMLNARVRFSLGEFEAALKAAESCIEKDQQLADAYVLAADVHLRTNDVKRAQHVLELGVSNNFELREHPRFQLANARVLKAQARYGDAVTALQNLLKAKLAITSRGRTESSSSNRPLTRAERVTAYLELIETQRLAGQEHEAVKSMQDALQEFRGTPDELRLQLANADLAAQRGDIDAALETLKAVQPSDGAYRDAREKMARILLNYRKDKRAYAAIYRELAERQPSRDNFVLLGDALMRILDVERAIEAYEQALKAQPKDLELSAKIGLAYVRSHNYSKAVNYYEAAISSAAKAESRADRSAYQTELLRADLAELLIRLRQFEKAERILRSAVERDSDDNSTENGQPRNELLRLRVRTRFVSLLARLLEEQSNMSDASKLWLEARTLQQRVIKKAQIEAPESLTDEKTLAASISEKLAEFTLAGVTESGSGDDRTSIDEAMKLYRESLTYTDRNLKALLALTKLSLRKGDHETCQQYCQMLIKQDPKNIAAIVILGEVLYVKGQCAAAIEHYDKVLATSPSCFEVLARQLDFKRWTGDFESPSVKEYFSKAEKDSSMRSENEPGFHFCRGLFEWYSGNANAALRYFNMARKDQNAWGVRALINMVEICLNPDNDIMGSEVADELEAAADESVSMSGSKERDESRSMAIRTAETLLKELRSHVASTSDEHMENARVRLRLLDNMLLISSKQKAKVQQAITDLTQFMNEHADHVGGSYALACASMMLKDSNKARGYLKKVHRVEWTLDNALDLERALLMVCDKLIHGGNSEQATELLKKCVSNNRACVKAHELLGYIAEKEQNHKEAAKHYQAAWRYSGMQNLAIGYKLAFTYLKLKRFPDAMQVCDKVIRKDPNYPKIRKEIFEKSRSLFKL